MNRTIALSLLNTYVKNPRMISHSLASELIMRKLAQHLGENEEEWGLAGLLHDLDVEFTEGNPKTHGQECIPILRDSGVPENVIEAISLHNEDSAPSSRTTKFHHALAAGETLSGMIFATALVYPDKRISSVKASSVIKRMKDKRFAASVKRENILECEKIGLSPENFIQLALEALSPYSKELME
ncbi:MAG: HDIG domain-containing protein [Bacteroidales bacterium]|nr:HDIG domain-containing protein [Bacteroidales bacterium]